MADCRCNGFLSADLLADKAKTPATANAAKNNILNKVFIL
jgi:hypothetical protein